MVGEEVRRIREKLGMTRDDFALAFGLSGYRTVMNIETGFRRPSRLTIILLRVLDSLPRSKAAALLELMRKYSNA